MPRSRSLLLVLVLTAGCSSEQQAVFVDLESVVAAESLPVPPNIAAPQQPGTFEGSTLTLPPLKARTLRLEDTQQRINRVQDVIRKAREQAYRELSARLRETYLNEIKQIETERLGSLEGPYREAIAAVLSRIRSQFEAYAEKRGPKVVKLALLAGFPDSDPQSQRPPPQDKKWPYHDFLEAKQLRAEIAALDKEYELGLQAVLDEPDAAKAEEITKIRVQIEQMRADADRRAQEEAAKQVQREQEELRSALADKREVTLPAIPGRTVKVPGSDPVTAPPKVEALGVDELRKRLRATIQSDLTIWAGQRDYKLVKKGAGTDATKEFIEWRNGRHAGL